MPHKILVVDDHGDTALVLRDYFEHQGFYCDVAMTGKQAVQKFKSKRHTLIVTDYMIPDMNGADLIAVCKEVEPNIKVIYLTGFDIAGRDARVRTGPNCRIAEKPARPKELLAIIQSMLQ